MSDIVFPKPLEASLGIRYPDGHMRYSKPSANVFITPRIRDEKSYILLRFSEPGLVHYDTDIDLAETVCELMVGDESDFGKIQEWKSQISFPSKYRTSKKGVVRCSWSFCEVSLPGLDGSKLEFRQYGTPHPINVDLAYEQTKLLRSSKHDVKLLVFWDDQVATPRLQEFLDIRKRAVFQFMELPAELRNHIYELACVEKDNIVVTASGFAKPALFQVSKQIRKETEGIFYEQNVFMVVVDRWDPAGIEALHEFAKKKGITLHRRPASKARQDLNSKAMTWCVEWSNVAPHWSNFLKYMRTIHAGRAPTFGNPTVMWHNGIRGGRIAIAALTQQAFALRPLPWNQTERVLIHQRPTLGQMRPEWMIDY